MTGESGARPRRCAVIGAGVLGVCLAVRLAEAGAEVTLLERDEPGQAATRSSFAWLNSNDKAPRAYHDLNEAGLRAWDRLAARLDGAAWYRPAGNLEWAASPAHRAELTARVGRLTQWGYPARLIDPAEARALEPSLRLPFPAPAIAWFPGEGYLLTAAMVSHLAERAVQQGVRVMTGEPGRVTGFGTAARRPAAGSGWSGPPTARRSARTWWCAARARRSPSSRRWPVRSARSRWSPGRNRAPPRRGWWSRRARWPPRDRSGSCTRPWCTCGRTPGGWCTWKRPTRPWTCTRPSRICGAGLWSC